MRQGHSPRIREHLRQDTVLGGRLILFLLGRHKTLDPVVDKRADIRREVRDVAGFLRYCKIHACLES